MNIILDVDIILNSEPYLKNTRIAGYFYEINKK